MIHPRQLLRTNSNAGSFSAPVHPSKANPIDCGITALPCLADKLNLERWAKAGVFLMIFTHLGFFQGAILSYFRGTSHVWMQHYQFSSDVMEWLLYMNEIFVGIFAFTITYWGDKIHRPAWLGALAIFHAFASCILIVPEIYEPFVKELINQTETNFLCTEIRANLTSNQEFNYIALVVLVLYQMFFSFVSIAFYTLGITYLDDNIDKSNAAAYICVPLAVRILGKQTGMYLSWVPYLTHNVRIFVTPMWLGLASLIFVFGVLVTLFPRKLPSMLMKKAVASLVNIASGNEPEDDEPVQKKDGFFKTLLRLLKNPLLMLNIMVLVCWTTAMVNYELFQNMYFQSRFFVNVGSDLSGYQDPILAKIIMNIIKFPFIATSVLATGLIVAKMKPKPKSLALLNVNFCIVAALTFTGMAFFSCDDKIHSELKGTITTPYCSSGCVCNTKNMHFAPVCTQEGNLTYFSPCHAGCANVEEINNVKIYRNCTCGQDIYATTVTSATEGSCNMDKCYIYWALAQVSSVTCSSVLASGILIGLIINLRSVQPSDKSMALALETTLLGILPYVPGKVVYSLVADAMCRYRGDDKCLLHSESFGLFFSLATIVLIAIAAIFAIAVVFMIGNLKLYEDEEEEVEGQESDDDVSIQEIFDDNDPNIIARQSRIPEQDRLVQHADDNLDFRIREMDDDSDFSTPLNTPQQQRNNMGNRTKSNELLESAF